MGREISFSNAALARLKKPDNKSRQEYRDRGEGGLYLYVTQTGIKTYYLYRKHEGRPLRIKIGRYPDLSVTAARKRARELKGELALGIWSESRPGSHKQSKVTLRTIEEEYIATKRASLKKSTIKLYQNTTKLHLACWFDLPISTISKEQLKKRHDKITSRCGGPTANLAIKLFQSYFQFFIDRYDYPGVNPVATFTRNRLWHARTVRKSIIENSDLPKWVEHVVTLDDIYRDYLLLLLLTGLRRSEAAGLRWENLRMQDRKFVVADTKNRDELELPMSDAVFRIFQSRGKDATNGFVFPSPVKPEAELYVGRLAKEVSSLSGVQFMLHDLRRTFVTTAESLDISGYAIKRLVNHRSGSSDVTAGYMVFNVDRLREPAERIAQKLIEIGRIPGFD